MEVPITPEEYVAARLNSIEREMIPQTARSCQICGADAQGMFCESCKETILTMRNAIDSRIGKVLEQAKKERGEPFTDEELKFLLVVLNTVLDAYEEHDVQTVCEMVESIIEKIQKEMGRRE